MTGAPRVPRLLLVGGGAGLVGRHVLPELLPTWRIRSVHRHPSDLEAGSPVEWVRADVRSLRDWLPLLEDVDAVVNVAWYRAGRESLFRELHDGLVRLLEAARTTGVRRFVHLSVPRAPDHLESGLPYLRYKRQFDAALSTSGLSYRILRPTMMFAPRDVLVTVMMRTMWRYRRFPIFGDGGYHLSPVSAADVARIIHREIDGSSTGTVDVGGPRRYSYQELTDLQFSALGLPAKYWRLSTANGIRLARVLETVGSHLLYAYEVEWLVSDLLGQPPYEALPQPLERLEPFLARTAASLRAS